MALMTAIEASYGGEAARERNAAREQVDALVAEVARRYAVQAGQGQFTFHAKESDCPDWAMTTGTITNAGEWDIAGHISFYCTLPLEAFIEYSRRRVYANLCQRIKALSAHQSEAAGIPAQALEVKA